MTKFKTYMVLLTLVLPTVLGACGGSKTLKASDINVSVSCGAWASTYSLGKSECTTTVKNNSSASGVIYISWDWVVGDTNCGSGFSINADGQPGYVSVAPNETGSQTAEQTMMCAAEIGDPVPSNIKIRVGE